jgi:translation initiation factor 2B subunit (eIF-2B alpha/beta/delta family)
MHRCTQLVADVDRKTREILTGRQREVDFVLLGADRISDSGSVSNKTGSLPAVLSARHVRQARLPSPAHSEPRLWQQDKHVWHSEQLAKIQFYLQLTVYTDASAALASKEVDFVLLGADRISDSGSVSNKTGSLPAVLSARHVCPVAKVLVLSELEKVAAPSRTKSTSLLARAADASVYTVSCRCRSEDEGIGLRLGE